MNNNYRDLIWQSIAVTTRVILILMTTLTLINDEHKAGLFAREKGDRQVLMSTAVWQYQVRMEMRPQSIFAKVMSLFHKNIQADSLLQCNWFPIFEPQNGHWEMTNQPLPA